MILHCIIYIESSIIPRISRERERKTEQKKKTHVTLCWCIFNGVKKEHVDTCERENKKKKKKKRITQVKSTKNA